MLSNISKFIYTFKHKIAFAKIEKQLRGFNTFRSITHDLDKLFMLLIMPAKKVNKIHRKYARHHDNLKPKTKEDYIEMVIDWECARYTKPDKLLNAKQTLERYYPHLWHDIIPILRELGLDDEKDLFEMIWSMVQH